MSTESPQHEQPDPPRPPLQPPPGSATNVFMSTLSYFTEPVTYTVSGLIRRLSEDTAPTPLAHALSANYNGGASTTMPFSSSSGSSSGAYYQPPAVTRRLSPFQPPPLTPLSLHGYKDTTHGAARLLRKAVAEEIRLLVPPRLQLVERWQLAYSLAQDGSTLSTLYGNCDAHRGRRGGFVLVVRDGRAAVFGAYLSDPPRPHAHYFGNGECFLWRALVLPHLPPAPSGPKAKGRRPGQEDARVEELLIPELADLPPPPSADTTHLQRMTTIGISGEEDEEEGGEGNGKTNGHGGRKKSGDEVTDRIRFKAFPYTGENDFTIFCQNSYLSVGGGDGHYGLWLDDNLSNGVSDTCLTFGNEPLSDEGKKFDVLGVEVWFIGS